MIYYSESFKKAYKKRISKNPVLIKSFKDKINLLNEDPHQAGLKTHKLVGELKPNWAFSLNHEYRVIFQFCDGGIILINIGTHDQVY